MKTVKQTLVGKGVGLAWHFFFWMILGDEGWCPQCTPITQVFLVIWV